MEQLKMYYYEVEGTHYEIGQKLGHYFKKIPRFLEGQLTQNFSISQEDEENMLNLFDTYCPGLNEEILGFADALDMPKLNVLYYALTYLKPGCSQMALLPSKTTNGHTLLARNYEFNDKLEDHIFCSTKVTGKYAHIGSTSLLFGRADGMNECGLGISQTSAGMPVGNAPFLRQPAIVGLQFWAVIRVLLENCKDVDEALDYLKEIPIAYNINLMVADKKGNAVLFETLDGRKVFQRIDVTTDEQFLHATNHVHFDSLKPYEPTSMRNSIVRYDLIHDTLTSREKIDITAIKTLLSTPYPNGLCCHYYDEGFGTLRSMVFDLTEGLVNICFGSPVVNDWHTFKVQNDKKNAAYCINMKRESVPQNFYDFI